jgi:hypothetical protein
MNIELISYLESKLTDCKDLNQDGVYIKHINSTLNIEVDINNMTLDIFDIVRDNLVQRRKLTLNNVKRIVNMFKCKIK